MLYDADRILDMGFLRGLYKNFAVITLAVSVSLWLRLQPVNATPKLSL